MKKIMLMAAGLSLGVFGCKNADPEPEEGELITTVLLTFSQGSDSKTYTWKDLDGAGGKDPVFDKIVLKANSPYNLAITFKNESVTPTVDMTTEIRSEGDEHLVVVNPSPVTLFKYVYLDKDANNLPIGLLGSLITGPPQSGDMTLQLRHQPPINGKRTKDGSVTPGSDDIRIVMPVVVN